MKFSLRSVFFPAGGPDVVPASASAAARAPWRRPIGERHQLRVDVSEERSSSPAHLKGKISGVVYRKCWIEQAKSDLTDSEVTVCIVNL